MRVKIELLPVPLDSEFSLNSSNVLVLALPQFVMQSCHYCCYIEMNLIDIVLLCSEEGKVRKVLKVEPLPDGSGHFFNLGNALFP